MSDEARSPGAEDAERRDTSEPRLGLHDFDGVTRAGAWLDVGYAGILFSCVAYVIEPYVTRSCMDPSDPFNIIYEWLLPRGVSALIVIAGISALLFSRQLSIKTIGLYRQDIGSQILAGMCSVPFVYLALLLTAIIVSTILWLCDASSFVDSSGPEYWSRTKAEPRIDLVLIFILLGVILEELIFRGVFLTRLRIAIGSWRAAVLISSAAFATIHISSGIIYAPPAFAMSLVWSYLYIRRASLLSTIVGHFLFNVAQLLLLPKFLT